MLLPSSGHIKRTGSFKMSVCTHNETQQSTITDNIKVSSEKIQGLDKTDL
jgi:hypothetical protein